jgi:hypothetical protein
MSQLPTIPEIKTRLVVLSTDERLALVKRMQGELSVCRPMEERELRSLLLERTMKAIAEVEILEKRICEYPQIAAHASARPLPGVDAPLPSPLIDRQTAAVFVWGGVAVAGVYCAYHLIRQIVESGVLVYAFIAASVYFAVTAMRSGLVLHQESKQEHQAAPEREIIVEQFQKVTITK